MEKYKALFYGSVISLWFQKALWNSLAQYRGNSENLKQLLSVDNLPSSLCSHFFFNVVKSRREASRKCSPVLRLGSPRATQNSVPKLEAESFNLRNTGCNVGKSCEEEV